MRQRATNINIITTAGLVLLSAGSAMRADLYVTRSFTQGASLPTAVLRFNEGTGSFINASTVPAEEFLGVEVARNADVFALDNTLGIISARRFTSALSDLGTFGPPPVAPTDPSLYFQHAGLTIDPQDNLLVASVLTQLNPFPSPEIPGIFKLDALTGGITSPTPFAGTPDPYDLQYGPNGNLFVSDRTLGVIEFDGTTGAFVRTVVADNGTTVSDIRGISIDQLGDLFLASGGTDSVLRYNLTTQVLDTFVPDDATVLLDPRDIDFGPDGNLYVASLGQRTVLRYRGNDGTALGEFTQSGAALFGVAGPQFLAFPAIPEARPLLPLAAIVLTAGAWVAYRRR